MSSISFVQLSDLHVGVRMLQSRFVRAPRDGYNPHDAILLEPLRNALRRVPSDLGLRDGAPPIVITGDLTAGGTDNDFAIVQTLLHQRWTLRGGAAPEQVGLGLPPPLASIPGNHDHWASERRQHAYNAALTPALIASTPAQHTLSSGGLTVQLFTIDSNPRPAAGGVIFNLRAAGNFIGVEWDAFEALVRAAGDVRTPPAGTTAIVRAVLCHHAFDQHGHFQVPAPLDTPSRSRMLRFAAEPSVRIFAALTGHNHRSVALDWRDPAGSAWRVRELRAAAALAGRASAATNGFFVHQVTLDDAEAAARPRWHVHEYRYDGCGSFSLAVHDVAGRAVPA